jgi:flagellin
MRIQHNTTAMNALSNYNGNNSALSSNLEKLSSGYRINSAADDAAGLAISEKMRAQIAGLEKAQDNTNDGVSLVQTAEGALTEVNSMLTRLTELATQSANGTYDNETDRVNIQEEADSILEEIDRIGDSTNFNGINLLDGSLSTVVNADASGTGITVSGGHLKANDAIKVKLNDGVPTSLGSASFTIGSLTGTTSGLTITSAATNPKDNSAGKYSFTITLDDTVSKAMYDKYNDLTITFDTTDVGTGTTNVNTTVKSTGVLSLQVGDTNAEYQHVSVEIANMKSDGLGLTDLDLSNQESAGAAIDTIKNAVNTVSLQRGKLGALQNRLDHTLNNLDATTQNITASESQIRDVDMAKEMTEYSKNNILVQAAQSMLAQANSMPQGVLQLLQ